MNILNSLIVKLINKSMTLNELFWFINWNSSIEVLFFMNWEIHFCFRWQSHKNNVIDESKIPGNCLENTNNWKINVISIHWKPVEIEWKSSDRSVPEESQQEKQHKKPVENHFHIHLIGKFITKVKNWGNWARYLLGTSSSNHFRWSSNSVILHGVSGFSLHSI